MAASPNRLHDSPPPSTYDNQEHQRLLLPLSSSPPHRHPQRHCPEWVMKEEEEEEEAEGGDADDEGDDVHLGLVMQAPPGTWSTKWFPWRMGRRCARHRSTAAYSSLLPHATAPRLRAGQRSTKWLLALLSLLATAPLVYFLVLRPRTLDQASTHRTSTTTSAVWQEGHHTTYNASYLLGTYLTGSEYDLVDPFHLAHEGVNSNSIDALPLSIDSPPPSPTSSPKADNPSINPSTIFTPSWATEHNVVLPVPAYAPITSDDDCLLSWVGQGIICPTLQERYGSHPSTAPTHLPPIDIVFMWVNGSDPLHEQAKHYWAYCTSASDAPARWEYCPSPFPSSPSSPKSSPSSPSSSPNSSPDLLQWDAEQQPKMDRFLRDIYPLIRAAEKGVKDKEYYHRRRRESKIGYTSSRFYEMDELRYVVRTTVRFLQHLGTIHLVSPDYPATALDGMAQAESQRTGQNTTEVLHLHTTISDWYVDPVDGSERVGQRPQWLNVGAGQVLVGSEAIQGGPAQQEPTLRLYHDSSLFRPVTTFQSQSETDAHKSAVLPTFNSMAIESALNPAASIEHGGWNASDTLLFANDDFFLLRPVGHTDIHSPLYGLILRNQHDLLVDDLESLKWSTGGEWPGLKMVGHMLDQRFGKRRRRYPLHVHRSGSAALMHEAKLIFREEVSSGMRARFRGTGTNVVNHQLLHNVVVERHREAALWSYIMLVLDSDGDGQIGYEEFQMLRRGIRRHHTGSHDVVPGQKHKDVEAVYRSTHPNWATSDPTFERTADRVLTPKRGTIASDHIHSTHAHLGLKSLGAPTEYLFSSWDGYALSDLYRNAINLWAKGKTEKHSAWHFGGWPWFLPSSLNSLPPTTTETLADDGRISTAFEEDQDPRGQVACTIEWKACLARTDGMGWMNPNASVRGTTKLGSEDLFRRMAFDMPACGDCLLTHLVSRSGGKGLSAVLPPRKQLLPGLPTTTPLEPHLPLSRTWRSPLESGTQRGANYSVVSVSHESGWGGKSAAVFVARMLQRYAYTMATTPSDFLQLGKGGPSYMRKLLQGVNARMKTFSGEEEKEDHEALAMVAVNDDITDHASGRATVRAFTEWLERTFPTKEWKTRFEL